MRARGVVVMLACGLLVAGCTSSDGAPDPAPTTSSRPAAASDGPATDDGVTGPPAASSSPTPEASPQVVFGTGTVTVDDVTLPVSGDCDISREFGEQPVRSLGDEEVDVLLAVDNITGDGAHDGPFAIQVRLLGTGAVEGRTISSQGAPGDDSTTVGVSYEGTVDVARLRDRRALEFVDAATLHLEADQQRAGGGAATRRRLVVDVVCPVSRPG